MSKIEVDAITEQSGSTLTVGGGASKTVVADATTVTLGRCGGTVSLASGATQSGFGRTGTVDWQTSSIKTSTFTAANGEGYFANTSGGAFNMNLPAGVAGAIVSVADYTQSFQTNNLTIVPNGTDKIAGINATAPLDTKGQSATFVFVDATEGWINTSDSTSAIAGTVPFIVASVSGACNTLVTAPCCANAKVATFTGPGTFTVCSAATDVTRNEISYMIVAGGGSSGGGETAGGGGAGGFREVKSPLTPYTASPLDGYSTPGNRVTVTAQAYSIAVGSGGATPSGSPAYVVGNSGNVSSFAGIISAGGGGGGAFTSSPGYAGRSGGSGGGGTGLSGAGGAGGAGNTPPVTPPQGQNGGQGSGTPGNPQGSGGGGGAGASAPAAGTGGGNGGNGVTTNINGSPVARAGGGGGGTYGPSPIGSGGSGGGGTGGRASPNSDGAAGTVNTGGGGGSEGGPGSSAGRAGGSGIVIIRYKFQ